jgi:hypothetical protein
VIEVSLLILAASVCFWLAGMFAFCLAWVVSRPGPTYEPKPEAKPINPYLYALAQRELPGPYQATKED